MLLWFRRVLYPNHVPRTKPDDPTSPRLGHRMRSHKCASLHRPGAWVRNGDRACVGNAAWFQEQASYLVDFLTNSIRHIIWSETIFDVFCVGDVSSPKQNSDCWTATVWGQGLTSNYTNICELSCCSNLPFQYVWYCNLTCHTFSLAWLLIPSTSSWYLSPEIYTLYF